MTSPESDPFAGDPEAIAAAESALSWTWTERGFRLELPQTRPGMGIPWAAVAAALLLFGAPLGLLEAMRPGLVGPILLTVLGLFGLLVFVGVISLVQVVESGEELELPELLTPQPARPVAIELRGEELIVNGDAWPLLALHEVAFERGRLRLATPGRAWQSRPVPGEVDRRAMARLVHWLRSAHRRSEADAVATLDLQERARKATRDVLRAGGSESGPET
ncbi:MAG: hypothetical protein AAF211_06840 [Myxococcota bacterium]